MEPYSPTVLKQGDSVRFDGIMPHGFVAVGDEDARILSVCLAESEVVKHAKGRTSGVEGAESANKE